MTGATEIATKLRDAAYGHERDSMIGAANAVDDAYLAFIALPTAETLQRLNGMWAAANRVLIKVTVEPQVA